MKIAIFSPHYNAYSETFIEAHRKFLKGKIFLYHTGFVPTYLDSESLKPALFKLKLYTLLISGYLRISKFTFSQLNIYYSLKKIQPDVVLIEYGPTAANTFNILNKLKIPFVVHFHGVDAVSRKFLKKFGKKYLLVFRFAFKIISVSSIMTQRLIEIGCPKNKIIQTCYGPNDIFFETNPTYKQPIFIGVGRFVEKKAPEKTIIAFSIVVKKHPQAYLHLVGDGPLKNYCEKLVHDLGLQNNVTFLGVLRPIDVRNEMNNSLAFVQHSVTASDGDMEGTPVSILEAQAAALPVVSTYHAGIPEIVIHEKTGFLVDEGDVEGMAKYMIRLVESKEEVKKMGLAGRTRIQDNFTMNKHIALIQHTLENAIM